MKDALNDIKSFPNFFRLYPNLDKCEIAGIGALKNVKNINLTKESIKILDVHIFYNKKIQDDLNFAKSIKNLCNALIFGSGKYF